MAEGLKIRIRRIPEKSGDPIEILCEATGIVSGRDTDRTVVQVFRTVVRYSREEGIGGSELSELSGVNRITCIHHLKRLEEAGIIERENRRYHLRHESLRLTMHDIREQALSMFAELERMAGEIDEETGELEREFHVRERRLLKKYEKDE
jgi:DNA-binding MarR family transcriptional regulator